MKKLLCLCVIALSCVIGCAPTDNGGAGSDDNTTSQVPATARVIANV